MLDRPLNILAVVGSLNTHSVTRVVIAQAAQGFSDAGCKVDMVDLGRTPLPMFNPEHSRQVPELPALRERVNAADVLVLGTPDYHGSMSGATKNFLDYFWHEFAGKLFVPIVASHEKGLTAIDQIRTVARQCYAWSLPYAVSFSDGDDVREGQIVSDSLQRRLEMAIRDARVYGDLLARQREADLAGADPGFMARHRNERATA